MRCSLMVLLILALTACGGEGDSVDRMDRGPASRSADGRFTVVDSFGGGYESTSRRARSRFVRADMVELSAEDGLVRVQVRGLPDTGPGETAEFLRNNTMYAATMELDGRPVRIGCAPGDPIRGRFERTALSTERISGEFDVEFIECRDAMSGAPVDVPGLPVVVTARFENLPLEE